MQVNDMALKPSESLDFQSYSDKDRAEKNIEQSGSQAGDGADLLFKDAES